ncbi:MAG TPA: YhjD/YihY/BrkB family envelope integrity protein, partial [Planctomycetota bacterium]|nr:YhjD/YihY/BrkB family envelope integrity protein [Planctomycetota bacterium]
MTRRRRGSFSEFTRLFFKALARASDRHAPLFAAGVAFFVFLSIFPALIAAVFSYGLIADAETIASHGERLAKLLPAEATPIVTMQLDALAENPPGALGWGVLTAMGVAIWSASRGAFYLLTAVQWIFGLEDVRSTFRQRLLAISMIAGTVVFAILSIGLIAVLPPILAFLEL